MNLHDKNSTQFEINPTSQAIENKFVAYESQTKVVNLAFIGHGLVGGTLINQINEAYDTLLKKKGIALNIFAIANTSSVLFQQKNHKNWQQQKLSQGVPYTVQDIINYAKLHQLQNLIALDNTASLEFTDHYETLIKGGFHLISSNKIANTLGFDFYQNLRQLLAQNQKHYLYETNVGAGLPLIETIKLLHVSGENITKIKGVFSGSLSYIFNHFSIEDKPFSVVVKEAIDLGYTEPDPREDLCGNDVGRKLLILARELELINEFEDINIQNLIPEPIRNLNTVTFLNQLKDLDDYFSAIKNQLKPNEVLRYVGELSGDLQQEKGNLEVKLAIINKNSPLGQLKGSDSFFEIYTDSYGANPIIIQGAGAGASVTARGVFGDILRLADKI